MTENRSEEVERVVEAALELTMKERLVVVQELQASMHLLFWAENEQAWREEIDSRTAALEAGQAKLTPSEDVAVKLRRKEQP